MNKIGKLRSEVWNNEGCLKESVCKENRWFDELDSKSIHWAVFHNNTIAASARLTCLNANDEIPHLDEFSPYDMKINDPYGFMSRLVVGNNYRQEGIAKKLDVLRINEARRLGLNKIIVLPTHDRVKSLSKLNFIYFGKSGVDPEEMLDLSIQTYVMVLDL
ncbi:MAG: hypothetical protein D3923_01935 [Candidatus Electrothrix sp. AR3]|nr:hypothetical protein [Candidatus Electrothrix sp. AR3]